MTFPDVDFLLASLQNQLTVAFPKDTPKVQSLVAKTPPKKCFVRQPFVKHGRGSEPQFALWDAKGSIPACEVVTTIGRHVLKVTGAKPCPADRKA